MFQDISYSFLILSWRISVCGLSDIMRHFLRNHHWDFNEACHYPVFFPCSLVYHLFLTILQYCIWVCSSCLQEPCDNRPEIIIVEWNKTLADKVSMFRECIFRFIIHIKNDAFLVTYSDSTIHFFCPIRYHDIKFLISSKLQINSLITYL